MHPFRRLTLFLIVWAVSFSTSTFAPIRASPTPDQPPRLLVSVFNDARVDSATLAEGEARASAVFSEAGIEVDWLVCGPVDPADFSPSHSACSALAWPSHLSVRIRPQAVSVSADTFGQAFVDTSGQGVYSSIYFQNLSLSAHHPQLSNAEMLGYVLAHELGHLLLGTNSHSHTGIMQARWDSSTLYAAARSSLFFTPSQSSTLRSRLSLAETSPRVYVLVRNLSAGSLLP